MIEFIVARSAVMLVTVFTAAVLLFTLTELLPGDAAQILLGTQVQADSLAHLRSVLGLDAPAHERFFSWIGGLLTGDLGQSTAYAGSVADMIGRRLMVSLPLAGLAFLMTVSIALPVGLFAASKAGSLSDVLIIGFAQIGLAIPNFWFGILMILVFSVALGWLPSVGIPDWEAGAWAGLRYLILPAFVLAFSEAAILSRMVRTSVLETLGEDFIRTARAKGASPSQVMIGHALGNAMIPITTLMGLQFGVLIVGVVVVEIVFSLPGIGSLMVQALNARDLPLLRDIIFMFGLFVMSVAFVVDVTTGILDPRLRRIARS